MSPPDLLEEQTRYFMGRCGSNPHVQAWCVAQNHLPRESSSPYHNRNDLGRQFFHKSIDMDLRQRVRCLQPSQSFTAYCRIYAKQIRQRVRGLQPSRLTEKMQSGGEKRNETVIQGQGSPPSGERFGRVGSTDAPMGQQSEEPKSVGTKPRGEGEEEGRGRTGREKTIPKRT
jgi:hypothetical protein